MLMLGALFLVWRMLTRIDSEGMPDTDWDLEIDHSEMQRLVAALTADKARVALRGGGGGNSSALDRDLATVKSILKDVHMKNLKSHGHAAPQLLQDNKRLEKELVELRAEIASLRGGGGRGGGGEGDSKLQLTPKPTPLTPQARAATVPRAATAAAAAAPAAAAAQAAAHEVSARAVASKDKNAAAPATSNNRLDASAAARAPSERLGRAREGGDSMKHQLHSTHETEP